MPTRDLAGGEDAERRLGAAEARRAGLHVRVRDEGAHDRGTSGADRLHQCDAGERFGGLLCQRAGHGDRTHRAHHDERRDVHDLVALREHPERLEHTRVEHQRRVRVDGAEDRRIALEHVGTAEDHLGHRDRVDHAVEVDLRGTDGEVGVLVHRELQVEVARVDRTIVDLDDRIAGRIDLGRHLRGAQQLNRVGERAVAATRHAVVAERHRLPGAEHHVVGAELHGLVRVARDQTELGWRRLDLLEHPVRIEEDDFVLDALAFAAEQLERGLVHELDPDLGHEALPAAIDGVERVLGEGLEARGPVHEHGAKPFNAIAELWQENAHGGGTLHGRRSYATPHPIV
jgi:hypothetical protein